MGVDALFIGLEATLGLSVIGVNLLVCVTVYLHREVRTLTNCLIACLALADLSVGALAVPCSIMLSLDLTLCFNNCLLLACWPLITTQFSVFVLQTIAINTHLKIHQPCRYHILVTKRRLTMAISICWISALIIGFTPVMGWNGLDISVDASTPNVSLVAERSLVGERISLLGFFPRPFQVARVANLSRAGPCSFHRVISLNYLVYFMFFCWTLLPLSTMLAVYAHSFHLVRRYVSNQRFRSAKRCDVHTARTLFLMMGLFCLCWLPLNLVNCLAFFCPSCCPSPWLVNLMVALSHLNSLLNPMVYALRKRDFGTALKAVVVQLLPGASKYKSCLARSKVSPVFHVTRP
ncbi:adenosine receptor A1-like [Hemiscyllium ocellatum]|uniref:adenosine receptor A1-like n=1 Tax=Hemiscyllium ocellatum TaxID=170820 RepID=UPI0029661CD7|nr:adenosine receptor A1-like [Hemiscyllium ocellatum]